MIRSATVLTHTRPAQTADALRLLIAAARSAGVELRFDRAETSKHNLEPGPNLLLDAEFSRDVDLCVVLGGDGTILRGLRRYAQTSVPVYAVNFGEVGFLATIDPDTCEAGFAQAMTGDFEVLRLPAILVGGLPEELYAINDISVHRKAGERVAQLAYGVGEETIASVRCDGLVVASPAGSTGYNLANGGPVMAWGVEGFVVTFIAPHSMTARALVVAPGDVLEVVNRSMCAVDINVDGLRAGELAPGEEFTVGFVRDAAGLAQVPGSSFYRRLRDKFGRLSS
jgi:NAD+ kinase